MIILEKLKLRLINKFLKRNKKVPLILDKSNFFTYHKRPIYMSDRSYLSDEICELPKLGIILQGPLLEENDFTFETVKFYLKTFENSVIIVSTWENSNPEYIKKLEKIGAIVVLNKLPDCEGLRNINYQIISSKNGILKAKELECEYAIKTRCDQRMCAVNIKEFLFNILKVFPLSSEIKIQKQRLITCSLNTFKYRLYGPSDMFMFGHIDDILMYFNVDFDNRTIDDIDPHHGESILAYCKCRVTEVYFCTEFLKKINKDIDYTLKDSWQVYKNHFCVVDKDSIDLYWPKYENLENRWLKYQPHILEELTFKEWLNLYAGLTNKTNIDEGLITKNPEYFATRGIDDKNKQ